MICITNYSIAVQGVIRKSAALYVFHEKLYGILHAGAFLHEITDKARQLAVCNIDHVVQYQYLTAASGAGADSDDGNGQTSGQLASQIRGHQFQNRHLSAGGFQVPGLFMQDRCSRFVAPLDAVPAEGMDGLRREPQMW